MLWTYNQTHDASLLELAKTLRNQAYPWAGIYRDNRFYDFGADFQPHHIVNVNQAFKFPAIAYQISKDQNDAASYSAGVKITDQQYGRIDGQISGTEMLSGRVRRTALNSAPISNESSPTALRWRPLPTLRSAIALKKSPITRCPLTPRADMRQITYYQMPNQVGATIGSNGFQQDYHNGNVPGPHSGFPCCCYNWHTGWPKFVQQMWMATQDDGVAAVAYGPNRLQTKVAGGVPLSIQQTTDYPFAETIRFQINPEKQARFPLLIRLPAWCEAPTIVVNGRNESGLKPGSFHRIDREWKAGDVVELTLPMTVRTSTWVHGAVGIERGPLAFALRIKEQWTSIKHYAPNFEEYTVQPMSPWNFAISLAGPKPFDVTTAPVPAVPFENNSPPVVLRARPSDCRAGDYGPSLAVSCSVERRMAGHSLPTLACQSSRTCRTNSR
ncbi:MAG: glycoside hydrolase family 127 protein [Tepidisphaeraceae bacterium]